MTKTASKERVFGALDHREPDRIPVDFRAPLVSGIHSSCVLALRDYFGLQKMPVKVIDPGQFLGEIDEELKLALGVNTEGVIRRMNLFGFLLRLLSGNAPEAFAELLVYDCRLMNTASARGRARELRDWLTEVR